MKGLTKKKIEKFFLSVTIDNQLLATHMGNAQKFTNYLIQVGVTYHTQMKRMFNGVTLSPTQGKMKNMVGQSRNQSYDP